MKIFSIDIKTVLVWAAFNTCLASIISCFIYMAEGRNFIATFLVSQIITHTISFSTVFVSSCVRVGIGTVKGKALTVAAALSATAASAFLAIFFAGCVPLSKRSFSLSDPWMVLVPALMITLMITVTSLRTENLRAEKSEREREPGLLSRKENCGQDGFSVRTDGEIRYIRFADIVYLSSSGRSTVIHTDNGDFEVFQLLGDIGKQLPGQLIRIHKQFIVSTSRISRLKYYMGGRYNLHLDDEDESILPVGKTYIRSLKLFLTA